MIPIRIDTLEIVAFADALAPGALPRVVAPIFRLRNDPATIIFPPFKLADEFVVGAQIANPDDLERLASRNSATMLAEPITPRPSSVLWVENGTTIHYESAFEHTRSWETAARQKMQQAHQALFQKDLPTATRLAQNAFALDERRFEAIALQVAVAEALNKPIAVAALRKIGLDLVEPYIFDAAAAKITQRYMPKPRKTWEEIYTKSSIYEMAA